MATKLAGNKKNGAGSVKFKQGLQRREQELEKKHQESYSTGRGLYC